MSAKPPTIEERVLALRREFDAAFARPAAAAAEGAAETLIGVRAGDRRFAVRVAEIAGIHARGRIVALPGGAEGLLGIAGIRGALHAVFELATLLGDAGGERRERARWLLLARGPGAIALAVDALDGHFRAAPAELHPAPRDSAPGEHVSHLLGRGDAVRGVVSVASLLAAIERRPGAAPTK